MSIGTRATDLKTTISGYLPGVDLRDWIRDYAKAWERADEDLLVSREYWNLEKGHREPYPGWGSYGAAR